MTDTLTGGIKVLLPDGNALHTGRCPTCGTIQAIPEETFQAMMFLQRNNQHPMPVLYCPMGHKWHYLSKQEIEALKNPQKPAEQKQTALAASDPLIDALLERDKA